jgi:hypothetical protein
MSRELFRHVLPQLSGITTHRLRLHIDGEPMLHPDFLAMGLEANQAGHRLAVASNLSCLRNEYLSLAMDLYVNLSAGPDEHQLRSPGDFQLYVRRIRDYILSWKSGLGAQHLYFKIYYNSAESNAPQIMREKLRWAAFFAEDWQCNSSECWQGPGFSPPLIYRRGDGYNLQISFQQVTEGGCYPDRSGIVPSVRQLPADWGFCDSPWKILAIHSDGRVGFCCVDITGKTIFTSPREIWERDLRDIWMHDRRLNECREAFLAGQVLLPICQQCLRIDPNQEKYLFTDIFPESS